MQLVKKYSDLPQSIAEEMKNANVFFSEKYYNYSKNIGTMVWYAFDEQQILAIDVHERICIKYAMYPSESYFIGGEKDAGKEKKFLNEVQDRLKQENISWVSSAATALFETYPNNSLRIPFGSHIIDLHMSEEEMWANIHSKHRNCIRRAEKNGVIIRRGGEELIHDYDLLDAETWARSNRTSYGEKFFKNIITNMKENAVIYIAYKDNIPQAGACYYVNKAMCYYMYGCSADKTELGATNYMHWEAIKYFKKIGVEKYSFVGCRIEEDEDSKYHSIQRFKARFGGTLKQGYMFKTILNSRRYRLFRWMYKIKNKSQLTDAVDQEISKWQSLQDDSQKE